MKTKEQAQAALKYLRKYHPPYSNDSTYTVDGEYIHTIITALEAMVEGGWMPIETAPKEGTVIRVWDGKSQCDAWHGKDYNYESDPALWLCGDGDDWSTGHYYTPCRPTHWMPLPQPPKGQDNIEKSKEVLTERNET